MSDSSDLQSIVEQIQLGNYLSLVTATAIAYDFIITFPTEIDYIWNRRWTFVSAMFIIVRYLGTAVGLIFALFGTTFIPGPTVVSTALLLMAIGSFVVFLAAADIVMILRVYAMYNKSKIILGVLLVFYVSTLVLYTASAIYYNNPDTYLTMTTVQLLDMSFCNPVYTYPSSVKLGGYKVIPRLTLAGLLFLLVIARLCIDSYQSYKATKQWKVNRYIRLLVREGILYFFVHLIYNIDFGVSLIGQIAMTFSFILMYVLSPRFIMNVRELHLRNLLHVSSGSGWDAGIDSAFGISRRPPFPTPVISSGFADSETIEFSEGELEMQGLESHTSSRH